MVQPSPATLGAVDGCDQIWVLTLDTYGHLWPDCDDSTRAAIEAVMVARADSLLTAEGGDA
jgi:hypothetical protein